MTGTKIKGIIILEGGDSSGKTTLATKICERYDATYLHGVPFDDCWDSHLRMLREAMADSQNHLVVVDRHWISEQVYGPIKRGRSQYNIGARSLDRLWRKHAALYVLCVPEDIESQVARWKKDRRSGREEYVEEHQIKDVLRVYRDLYSGNIAHGGDLYLDHWIQWGDFSKRDDVVRYDLDVDGKTEKKLNSYVTNLVERCLQVQRAAQYQPALRQDKLNVAGYLESCTHLIVGEQLSPKAALPWPFCWGDDLSAATWLNLALEAAGIRETRLMFTNAIAAPPDRHLDRILTRPAPGIIPVAMGNIAAQELEKLGYDYVKLRHPQYMRRFRHHEFDKYVDLVAEALVLR